ncbi:MAG: DUF1624 domain-containing protein [Chitinophagales bacterium]
MSIKRIHSVDVVRGIVMIIMALDHIRDFMHTTSITQSPTDLMTTTPQLFFTRWITHLCAPTFVFLSGVSAYLSYKGKNDPAASRRFLLSRGLWLIVVEFTLVNFGLWFDIHFRIFFFDVIATIGCGFIILSLLINTSPKTIGAIGLIIILCHNLVPLAGIGDHFFLKNIIIPLFNPSVFPVTSKISFVMGYPPIPWAGVMLIGFALGKLFELPAGKKRKLFLQIGLTALALFSVIRFINIYGDPFTWSKQKNGLFTFLSFINITKYPPSLLFCLATLGIMFLILAWVEGMKNKFTDIVTVYGKVPLFYFIVHWYIIHPIMFAMVFLQGFKSSDLVFGFNFGRPKEGSGVDLWIIYLVWIAVVITMYPLCKWYGKYKVEHREKKWLRYL